MTTEPFEVINFRRRLQRVALTDWIAARLLWNLGLLSQAMVLSVQSLEKCLKLYRASNQTYSSAKALDKAFRVGEHNLVDILNDIDPALQPGLKGCKGVATRLEALRYANNPYIGYSEKGFRDNEKFIKRLRVLLGDKIKRSHFEEWKSASLPGYTLKRTTEAEQIVKGILSLKNSYHTRKDKMAFKRAVARAINRSLSQ